MTMLIFPILLFALQFIFVKEFQNRAGHTVAHGFFMNMVVGAFAFVVLLIIKGFSLHFTWLNVLLALFVGLGIVTLKTALLKAVSLGRVAISTMFYVLGGVLFPFIFGIVFLDENLTVPKLLGMIFILLSLLPIIYEELSKKENRHLSVKFLGICFIVFVANGLLAIIVKINQTVSEKAYTLDFIAVYSLFIFLIATVGLLVSKRKMDPQELKELFQFKKAFSAAKVSICNTTANIIALMLATTLPASLQFPIMQSGIMIATTLLTIIVYKEIPTKKAFLSLAASVVAIVLLVL